MLERFKVPDDIAIRVKADDMRATVENLFKSLGMPEQDAVQAADVLIYADIRGIDSHGVSNMTRAYVAGFQSGYYNPTPERKIARDTGAAITIDCDRGLGLAMCPPLMDLAIERARQHGICVAIAFNAGHYGPSAYYAHRALAHNMIGMSMTTGGVHVVPTHGAEPLLGLNPIGIAVPSNNEVPYIFDASMSSLALNKIRLLKRLGGEVAPGWVTEADGTPKMDAGPVPDNFMMLPLGGTRDIGSHKGMGLMMLVEVLTSVLAGTGAGPDRRADSAHYFMAYNIEAFTELELFKDDMDSYLKRLRESQTAPGEDRVVYPGMLEHEDAIDRTENGIPYHPEVIDWFKSTCEELQVSHLLDAYQ
ncbi:MAG: Ldh family oxidoreductase [Gammaproteobacteria bacterium]|nr:Ldh family oxidoreductase [Gammaproteobacteria bacterium]